MDEVHCYDCGDEEDVLVAVFPTCDVCGEPVCPDCSWLHQEITHGSEADE